MVTDKLVSDFNETEPENVPSFTVTIRLRFLKTSAQPDSLFIARRKPAA